MELGGASLGRSSLLTRPAAITVIVRQADCRSLAHRADRQHLWHPRLDHHVHHRCVVRSPRATLMPAGATIGVGLTNWDLKAVRCGRSFSSSSRADQLARDRMECVGFLLGKY